MLFVEVYVGQALASDVVAYLLARGFTLMCVANLEYGQSQRPIQADFLFVRRPDSNQRQTVITEIKGLRSSMPSVATFIDLTISGACAKSRLRAPVARHNVRNEPAGTASPRSTAHPACGRDHSLFQRGRCHRKRRRRLSPLAPSCDRVRLGIGWFVHSGHLVSNNGPLTDGVGSLHNVANAFAWPTIDLYYARLVGVAKLLLWAAPCVLVLAFAGAWRTRRDARFAALGASALLTFVGYLFVWADQGHGWGFRYFHSAWLVLPLFATAFLFMPAAEAAAAQRHAADPAVCADLCTYVMASALLSPVACVGLRASQMNEFMIGHLGQLPRYAGTEPRVIIIAAVGFYPYDLVQNDPFLRKNEVRMVDLGAELNAAAIQRHFPGYRAVYRDDHGEVWSAAPLAAAATH
jgi:hypothetical protein